MGVFNQKWEDAFDVLCFETHGRNVSLLVQESQALYPIHGIEWIFDLLETLLHVFITLKDTDEPQMKMVRFRTLGDITITGGQESDADTLEKIIQEVASSRQTERGNREDDKRSESAMEDRKRQGYF